MIQVYLYFLSYARQSRGVPVYPGIKEIFGGGSAARAITPAGPAWLIYPGSLFIGNILLALGEKVYGPVCSRAQLLASLCVCGDLDGNEDTAGVAACVTGCCVVCSGGEEVVCYSGGGGNNVGGMYVCSGDDGDDGALCSGDSGSMCVCGVCVVVMVRTVCVCLCALLLQWWWGQ